ncbi:hypothetical protein [Legionella septentrionalis]|uniref:hypothetical protein n=1 Tax=Legionella septentrionalis TaxID=2498109 RepID=UPI000F8F1561|nr:hypothetical protein [Legionella septentrionalis]RUQ99579.1 hypothetical protein ELY11_04455 [Legionella septentrionalis]
MRKILIPAFVFVASVALSGCGVYATGCGTTCPTTRYVTTYTTTSCCATCDPCYGYGYSWY